MYHLLIVNAEKINKYSLSQDCKMRQKTLIS